VKKEVNKIRINADDFGLTPSINSAIIEAFEKDYINSATLMANMPGFDEAVFLIHKQHLNLKIGAHLVLSDGISLTDKIKSVNFLFEKKPSSKKEFLRNLFFLNSNNKKLIFNEFCAQIERIRRNRIPISHIDTHHHIHEVYSILEILMYIRKIYGIPSIRIMNNLGESPQIHKTIYRSTINYYLKRSDANNSDLFGNQVEFQGKLKSAPDIIQKKSIEIMVHPDYDKEGRLIDKIGKENFDFNFSKIVKRVA
jgi:predicted glycoside hydrolase/deacetylase ChbG (UPF0249 family)